MGKRRTNGEGTVYRRRDGRWTARYYDASGVRRAVYGSNRAEVSAKLRAHLKDVDDDLPAVEFEQETLEAFLRRWLDDYRTGARKYNTGRGYESYINNHVVPALGRIRVAKLSPQDVQSFYRDLLTKKRLSPTTVRHIHAMLGLALKRATAWGLARRNVATLVNAPRRAPFEAQPYTAEEAQRFVEAVQGDDLAALYILAVSTGMREGELLALRWSDVDFKTGVLRVQRNVVRPRGGGFRFEDPKSASGRRAIKLPPVALEALLAHSVAQKSQQLRKGDRWEALDLVFPNKYGRPLEPTNLIRRFRLLLPEAGLRVVRFQDLRHTFATLQVTFDTPPKIAAAMLGHSNPQVTLSIYQHAATYMQEAATERMDALLRGGRADKQDARAATRRKHGNQNGSAANRAPIAQPR